MGDLSSLRAVVGRLERLVVAFSGGADSSLLAWVALDTLGPEAVLGVTAESPSLPAADLAACEDLARSWGMRWQAVPTHELDNPAYTVNAGDRCHWCKDALMDALAPIAAAERATVALGVNLDDLGEHRPGQEAAAARGAAFPLVEAGLTKAAVRAVSRAVGLETWDRPAAACLASRLPYGTTVTVGALGQVERAEAGLHALGFRQVRVRHYGDAARIELESEELADAVARRHDVIAAVRAAGYDYVTLDLEGFRSGNLNAALAGGARTKASEAVKR